jgi:hypothetical protein
LLLQFGAGFGNKIACCLADFREPLVRPLVRQNAALNERLGRRPKHLPERWHKQERTEPDRYSSQRIAFEHIFQQSHQRLLWPSRGAKFRPHRNS